MNKLKGVYMNKLFGLLFLLSLSGFSSVAYASILHYGKVPISGFTCPEGQTYNFQIKEGGGFIGCESSTSTPPSTPPPSTPPPSTPPPSTPTSTCSAGWYAKGDDCCKKTTDTVYLGAATWKTCSAGYTKTCSTVEILDDLGWISPEGSNNFGSNSGPVSQTTCSCRKSTEICNAKAPESSIVCEADETEEGSLCCKTETTRQYTPRSTGEKKCPAGQKKRGSSCYGFSETKTFSNNCPTGSNWYEVSCVNQNSNSNQNSNNKGYEEESENFRSPIRGRESEEFDPQLKSCTCNRYDEPKAPATYSCPSGQTKSGNQCCGSQSYVVSSSSSSNSACTRGGTLGCTAERTRTFWVPNNNQNVNWGPDTQYECERDTWVGAERCVSKTVTTPKICSCTQTSCSAVTLGGCPSGYTDDGTQCYKDTPGVKTCRDPNSCPEGERYDSIQSKCVSICLSGQTYDSDLRKCTYNCQTGTTRVSGTETCKCNNGDYKFYSTHVNVNNSSICKCPDNTAKPSNGICLPPAVQCSDGKATSGVCCPNGKKMPVGGACCPDGSASTQSCSNTGVGNPPLVDLSFPRTFNVHGDSSVRSVYSLGRTDRPNYECYAYTINNGKEIKQRQPSAYCPLIDSCTRDDKNRCICKTLKNNKFVDITSSNNGTRISESSRYNNHNTYCEYAGLDPLRVEGSDNEKFEVNNSTEVMSREFKNVTTVTIPFVPPH